MRVATPSAVCIIEWAKLGTPSQGACDPNPPVIFFQKGNLIKNIITRRNN